MKFKNISLFVFALLSAGIVSAQDHTDAYRYSAEDLTGTARFRAMSGAFGALGGDMSAIGVNPAGSAIFLNSSATFTLDFNSRENTTNYFNGFNSSEESDTYFNQGGGVLVFDTANNSPWRKFTLAVNYSKTNNFDDSFLASGRGNNSIDQYFLGYAEGLPLDLLQTQDNESITDLYSYLGENEGFGAQQAMLGYQGFVIDHDVDDLENTNYNSFISPGNFDQEYASYETGLNGKFTFNLGTQFKDFLYLGASLNTHFLNYERSTRYIEINNNPGSETNEVRFNNNLSTTGDGFSFQLGAIGKVNENIRLGASYQSPTWFNIEEEATQYLETNNNAGERVTVEPNVVNIYPGYTLKTPSKLTGSVAVLFGGQGLISFDYSFRDYSNMEFRPADDLEFGIQNTIIEEEMRAASTYRVGGEYRIQNWSLRGGYRFEESPYENEATIGDLSGYSAGLGYNFGSLRLDLAYNKAQRDDSPQLYQVGLTDTYRVNRDFSSVVLSLSFGL